MHKVYLDNAATTHMHEEVIDAMVNAMKHNFGNPSSTHFFGRETKGYIEKARKSIARLTNVASADIVFTSCGTEANNLILRSSVDYLGIERIITARIEHSCVMETVKDLGQRGVDIQYVEVNRKGDLDLEHLKELLSSSDKSTLISLMHANNEIGNINPIEEIGNLAKEYGALFHSDMVQTLGHFKIDLENLPVDFASSSAHKFHGPKGIGFAYIKKSTGLKAQITGGGQERNMRSGTENVHGIIGMGKAFELAHEDYEKDNPYISNIKKYTIDRLKEAFPDIYFNGRSAEMNNSLYTVLSVSLPFRNDLMGFELDLRGIAASQGSACQSGATKASRLLMEILPEDFIMKTTPLRLSFSINNTQEDIDYLIEVLEEVAAKQKV